MQPPARNAPPPPPTPRRPVVEVLHGETVVDPYRWLEDGEAPEVRAWTEAQNGHTDAVLGALPRRGVFARRLAELWRSDLVRNPAVRGGRLFYLRRPGDQAQFALCLREDPDGPERVLVDPNALDERGVTALDWWYPSPDGRRLAYGCSRGGDEWSTLHVLDVDTGEHLADRIPRTRYASLAWEPDGSGFFYTRYPTPGEVPAGEENYHRHVFYHVLGEDPGGDRAVFGPGRPREELVHLDLSEDGRYLLIVAYEGWNRADVLVLDRRRPAAGFVPVALGLDALFKGRAARGVLYLLTNLDAPRYRVLAVDLAGSPPEAWADRSAWLEVVPEDPERTLDLFAVAGDHLLLSALEHATARVFAVAADGSGRRELPLPGPGTVAALVGEPGAARAFLTFESFVTPPAIYRVDPARGSIEPAVAGAPPAGQVAVTVKQVFYSSRDGTRVPMFVLHRRDVVPDGDRPTVLTGYGGFNIARTPEFNPSLALWLERGGVWALANLRGGSEYGEAWHRAGMLGNKQNVFDDFIAAAEYLIAAGYTRPERLGCYGRSNGGLLVGAALTQRPDLFRAVACGVPLLDMLRYHRFLIGGLWVTEYGSADHPEQFRWLHAYSPYHRVVDGTPYPAVYLFTAASDTRVDPMHARKMAARLQAASASGRPVLLRIELEAGHGAGKPVAKIVAEQAEVWSFLAWQLEEDG